ncbi:uncharacterized protein LOC144142799 isoform X2 [Haemaphysalis longicornis]
MGGQCWLTAWGAYRTAEQREQQNSRKEAPAIGVLRTARCRPFSCPKKIAAVYPVALDSGGMAGAQRGKPNGNLVRMTLSKDVLILCPVYQSSTAGLGCCAECGYIPEEVYHLSCYHLLCKQCFYASTEYVCKLHKQKTKIKLGVEYPHTFNLSLLKIFLQCPRCREVHRYNDMKTHIQTKHEECLERQHFPLKKKDSKPHAPAFVRQDYASVARGRCESVPTASQNTRGRSEATAKKGEQEWRGQKAQLDNKSDVSFSPQSQERGREKMTDHYPDMLTDDESSDASLEASREESRIEGEASEGILACRHCISACAVSEIKEHEDNCPDRKVKCHKCKEVITAKHYDEHMETHYRKVQMICKGAEMGGADERELPKLDTRPLGPFPPAARASLGEKREEEGFCGDVISMSDAKKYIEKVIREQKQSEEDTSMSTEDTEKYIAKRQRKQTERNERNNHRNEPSAAIHTVTVTPKIEDQGTRKIKRENESPTLPTPELEGRLGPDSTGTKKKNSPPQAAEPNAEQDKEEEVKKKKEVTALKNKIKELEHRLQNLERPLEALIKRLYGEQQQKRRLQSSTDL